MWSSIANLKENLNKIALDVHEDDDEDLEIYGSRNGRELSGTDRRSSNGFAYSRSVPRSPVANGFDSPLNNEIDQYKAEIRRLSESEAEIKALSVNYAALLKEREVCLSGTDLRFQKRTGIFRVSMMDPSNFQFASPPLPHWFPMLPPNPPRSSVFWNTQNVHNQLKELQDTLSLAKAMEKELEALEMIKNAKGSVENKDQGSMDSSVPELLKCLDRSKMDWESQEQLSVEAANNLISKLGAQLEPFRFVLDEWTPWEEKSAAARLAMKLKKSERNKLWRKRKRKRVAETKAMEEKRFEQADREADEWRAREIVKDIAMRKVEEMKRIEKVKTRRKRKGLEPEFELALIVEELQQLRTLRIEKLKKQGRFLPEEDDKFFERVQAAVEEEDAVKDAIASAEDSKKENSQNQEDIAEDTITGVEIEENKDEGTSIAIKTVDNKEGRERPSSTGGYNNVSDLPFEFYHYYYGSNHDMGRLIEVRREWDAYIRPGGSRIPGHWVHQPPPANQTWASYLVKPPVSKSNDP